MRLLLSNFLLISLLALWSCGGSPSTSNESGAPAGPAADSLTDIPPGMEETVSLPASHDCQVSGEVLEGNQFWIRDAHILIVILADSTTYDPDYGMSHRILEVYDTRRCDRIERKVLPVNQSPDFPYYLAEITYNNVTRVVAIRGFNTVYCYDVENRMLLPELQPQFLNERYGVDAQSGMIVRLEVWENYLVGHALDYGSFVFDLSDRQQPRAVLASAEYEVETQVFHQLFLLPTDAGTYQALLPVFDRNNDEFAVRPIFRDPVALNPDIPANVRNNRYLVLRLNDADRTPVAIDMKNRRRMDLPEEVAGQSTQQILEWMRREGGR